MENVPTGIQTLANSTGHKLFGRNKSVLTLRNDASPFEINEVLKNSNKSRFAVNWISGPNHEVQQ